MSFLWPQALLGLVLVPLAAAAYAALEQRRRRLAARWASPALFPFSVLSQPGARRHVPVALLLVALAALLVGAARPRLAVSAAREDATVMLALDTSYSMAARDVPPTRLAAARRAALRFLDDAPADLNIGLVSFESGAHLLLPRTTDRALARRALQALRPGDGTALGDAIRVALDAAGARRAGDRHPPAAILLLSDGAQTQGRTSPAAAAERARARSVPVYTVAIGTPQGVVERPLAGGFRERISVPPDPSSLRRVAALSGGQFFAAPDAAALRAVYERLASRLGHHRVRREVTAAFAGGAALLLLAGAALSSLWFQRLP